MSIVLAILGFFLGMLYARDNFSLRLVPVKEGSCITGFVADSASVNLPFGMKLSSELTPHHKVMLQ